MDRIGRAESHRLQIEILDDLQLLEQHEPGRVGRRFEHGEAAVVDPDRLLALGLELGEIGFADRHPGGGARGGEAAGEGAAVEALGAVAGDLLEGAGEIGLHDRGADRGRHAVRQEDRGAAPVGAEGREMLAGEVPVMRGRAEPVACVMDGFGEQVAPRQTAELAVHRAEAGDHARHRDRHRPGARDAAGIALGGRGKRRRAGGVEHHGAARPGIEHVIERVAAEPRHHRLDHRERERGRDRRIDRVAAGAQRQEPGLRRQRVVRRDGAAPPDDQRPIAAHFFHLSSPALNVDNVDLKEPRYRKRHNGHVEDLTDSHRNRCVLFLFLTSVCRLGMYRCDIALARVMG